MEIVAHSFKEAAKITAFVFVMMVLVDCLNVIARGRFEALSRGSRVRQYLLASLLGVLPGCLGTFFAVSLYVHGVFGFGALGAAMIATAGDESFVMFAMFPGRAALIHLLLAAVGFASAFAIDWGAGMLGIKPCEECAHAAVQAENEDARLRGAGRMLRLLREVTWDHVARKHIWRVFLWTFGALLAVGFAMSLWNVESFVRAHMVWVLLSAVLVGIIPQSGPHLVFVMMFGQGVIPFSVLFANSVVQDGHGMLPLLSYTVKDAVLIKIFNAAVGLLLGAVLFAMEL